jgi:hypothetical protein
LFSHITGLPAHAGPDTVLSYIWLVPIVLGMAYMVFLVWRENRPRDGAAAVTERSDQNDDEERQT